METTRVLDLLETPISIKDGEYELSSTAAYSSDIEINDLNFSYPNREILFSNLNLTISANKILGVVGPTGSGKTTLVRLLLRFASPSSGQIIWGGEKIDELTLDSLRRNISLVSQDITLFDDTVKNNIAYAIDEAKDEEILEAAKLSFADREAYYGDPDFVDVPLEILLSKKYNGITVFQAFRDSNPINTFKKQFDS